MLKNGKVTISLYNSIKSLIEEARVQVVRNVNKVIIFTHYEIGRMILENEQKGNERAGYAAKILSKLSADLTSSTALDIPHLIWST